jgi:hypothetical protein
MGVYRFYRLVRGYSGTPRLWASRSAPMPYARPRAHANISTTRIYDHRKTRPEDSPTFKVNYK